MKLKVLSVIIALAVFSVSIFAYLTFQSYKKDKLAFVYDHLASEVQGKSRLLSVTIANFDVLLGSLIGGLPSLNHGLSESHIKFLQQKNGVSAVYFHVPGKSGLEQVTLYQAGPKGLPWQAIKNAPLGLSLVDPEEGLFHLKKTLSRDGGFASLIFKQDELGRLIHSTSGQHDLVLNLQQVGGSAKSVLSGPEYTSLNGKINQNPIPSGLFEMELEGENYLVSFSKMNFQDLVLVSMIKEKKVMLIQDVFLDQVIIFLALVTSLSLLIGTLGARWLTYHLDVLTSAAREMEQENFDIHINVTSKDELGVLGGAFNSMGAKIKGLLEELKKYNLELEAMVEARTKELKNLSDIQKGMLNSLGQGFVIIDREHKVAPIYSKVAEDMFEVVPHETVPATIMGINEEETANFKELFNLAFQQVLDFDDMVKLNPEKRTNSKNQQIALNYAPIRNGESGELDYVLVIGTDKTVEMESMERFKKEWNFSQMITKIASNRFSVNKVITEALSMLMTCKDIVESDKDFALRDVQRLVHTIKGSVSFFNIEELTHLAHDFESYLTAYYNSQKCPPEIKEPVLDRVKAIKEGIESYVDQYDSIIQFKDSSSMKPVPVKDLENFLRDLRRRNHDLALEFRAAFFKSKIGPYFQMYTGIVKDLSLKLNKEARFVLEGADVEIPDGPWDELFVQFIHCVRNSMAHGMETPQEREEAGKPREGTITFGFEIVMEQLKITISDDGRGIDWQKMAAKDPEIKNEDDAIIRILTGGLSSQDEVSEVSGRGVGVSSVYATVQKWGGHLNIKNNYKKGMSIVISVPLQRAKEHVWLRSA